MSREHIPLYAATGGRQIGRVTSLGWSPILKKPIALASVPASHEPAGSKLSVEWTVEARRGRVGATVVELPFLDLPRKRGLTADGQRKNSRRSFAEQARFRQPSPQALSIVRSNE